MEKPGDAYVEEMAKSFWISKGIAVTRITETDMYRAGFDRCWNTYVVSLESDNKALREEINALNVDIQSYRNGHEANAKRYNDLLIERNKLKEEIESLKAEVLKEKFPEN